MKQLLLSLSAVTALALSGNSIASICNNDTTTNSLTNQKQIATAIPTQILNYSYKANYHTAGDNSNQYVLLKWSNYASNWDDFVKLYPNFAFDSNSLLKLYANDDWNSSMSGMSDRTSDISTDATVSTFKLHYPLEADTVLALKIHHDSTNIYFQWYFNNYNHWYYSSIDLTVILNSCSFY